MFTKLIDNSEELQTKHLETVKKRKQQLAQKEKRIEELDFLIRKLYETNALGKLSDERFEVLMEEYESEQKALRERLKVTVHYDIYCDFWEWEGRIRVPSPSARALR